METKVYIVSDEEVFYVYGKEQLIDYAQEQLECIEEPEDVLEIANKYDIKKGWNEEFAIEVLQARGFKVETKMVR